MRELTVEQYLARRVRELGGRVRKVVWVGRRNAPDRLVMLPKLLRIPGVRPTINVLNEGLAIWVELKNPKTILTFPANAHERAQAREHERMRALGQRVEVIGTHAQVDELLR